MGISSLMRHLDTSVVFGKKMSFLRRRKDTQQQFLRCTLTLYEAAEESKTCNNILLSHVGIARLRGLFRF